jgi:hypothetical protein
MAEWRYHALNILTRTWLHRDLPLRDVKISPELSGPQSITATISPEFMTLKTEDGRPLLDEWSTFIVCESDDIIRGGGILTGSQFQGGEWQLTINGFSTYPKGQPMTKTLSYGGDSPSTGRDNSGPTPGKGADPIQIVKDLWAQLQSHPDGNLRVQFAGSASSKYRMADWKNVPNVYTYSPDATTTITQDAPQNAQADDKGNYPNSTVMANIGVRGTGFTKKRKSGTGSIKVPPSGKNIYWNHFELWYEHQDIGQRIENLAEATPFDYVERIRWADADKSDIVLELVFGYPRLGTRRSDLRFVEGENISGAVPVQRDGVDFANNVQGVGAGEGKDQLRETVGQRDGRLRRVRVETDTSITNSTQLKNYATSVLNTVKSFTEITGFTVRAHPHAPFGSYQVGDDILVQTWRGWEEVSLWVRITSLSYDPESDEVAVTCKRSDSFRYGSQTA